MGSRRVIRYGLMGIKSVVEKNLKKIEKIFQKPLDKRKIFAIIKVQKERN